MITMCQAHGVPIGKVELNRRIPMSNQICVLIGGSFYMNEVFCFHNIDYRFVGVLTHLGTPYYVVELMDEEVYNFLYITWD